MSEGEGGGGLTVFSDGTNERSDRLTFLIQKQRVR